MHRLVFAELRADENRRRALQRIEHQRRRRRQILTPGAQHIGCPDIAGADRPQIFGSPQTRQQHAERNRAEQIADDERDQIVRKHRETT